MHKLYGGRHIIIWRPPYNFIWRPPHNQFMWRPPYKFIFRPPDKIIWRPPYNSFKWRPPNKIMWRPPYNLYGGRHLILYGGRHIILYGGRHISNIKCFLTFAILNCRRFRIRTLWDSLTDIMYNLGHVVYRV